MEDDNSVSIRIRNHRFLALEMLEIAKKLHAKYL